MVNNNTKIRSTPVVEKEGCPCQKEEGCSCGCECGCGCNCNCGCGKNVFETILTCGTIMVSAAAIAAAIMFKPVAPERHHMPIMPRVRSEQSIRAFIEKNPKLLIDTVEKYYADQEKGEAAEFDINSLATADANLIQQIIDDKTNYSLGNKDGKFVIIEFFDYQCGWCKRTNKGLEEAIASPEGKNIRWIPIDTPIFGAASETIARYVLAAGVQGKYAEMHKAVGEDTTELSAAGNRVGELVSKYIADNKLDGEKPEDQTKIRSYADEVSPKEYGKAMVNIGKKLKLNTKKLVADADGDKIKQKLASNEVFREKLNIGGVPMVIVDGHINPGALIDDRLAAVVKLSAEK